MQDAAGDPAPPGGGVVEGGDDEAGLHPAVDGPADDPVREHVLDGTQVELSLAGGMLGDVREPQAVRGIRAEVPAHQVVMRRGVSVCFGCSCNGHSRWPQAPRQRVLQGQTFSVISRDDNSTPHQAVMGIVFAYPWHGSQ